MAGAPYSILYCQGTEQCGCQHRLFFSQVEFCDNLIFRRRAALDKLGERLLDANRTIGQPNKITVIFGRRISKHYRGKLQTEIEDMDLPTRRIPAATTAMASSSSTFAIPHSAYRGGEQQRQRLRRAQVGAKSPRSPRIYTATS